MRASVRQRIAGTTVLITGGAQGIGARVARQLVDHGARVAILDRDIASARRLAGELGDAAAAFEADVTSVESMTTACAAAAERFGGLDVVVANAGIPGPSSTVAAVDPNAWRAVIDVNLVGVFHTAAAALPHLRQRRGYLMAVASIGAVIPGPTVSAYMASKSGVESLVRSLRIELSGSGVDVGIGYFGLVDTGLAREMLDRPGLGAVMAALPGAVGKPIPIEAAATPIVAGIARRARRVYAPRWVPILLDLRTLFALGDRLLAVLPAMRRAVRATERTEDSP